MKRKIRVGIVFGGKSAEHEVSLMSAKNIIEAINKNKYDVVLIGIDKQGQWYLNNNTRFLLNERSPKLIKLNKAEKSIVVSPGDSSTLPIDVVFPVLHGSFGEDGTVQGLLKLMNVPFVGASVLGSAVGMDKEVAKRLLKQARIPVAKFLSYSSFEKNKINFNRVKRELGLPFFIKPANSGSSIGISKIKNQKEFIRAINQAFSYDKKILIEGSIKGREIECSVLGNEKPIASIPGEVIPTHEFYDYEAKYIDEHGANFEIPAKLPKNVVKRIQNIAIKAFKTLCCEGMARVDFFVTPDFKIFVNEINTIPGFTKISMYPKLWQASGISYSKLIDKLIILAIERHKKEKQLKTSFPI